MGGAKSPMRRLPDSISRAANLLDRYADEEPIWKGPEEEGITQSLMSGYLVCKERFRLRVIKGLTFDEGFVGRLEYGQMWHECEEAHGEGRDWRRALLDYSKRVIEQHPINGQEIEKWYQVCRRQFPIYLRAWGEEEGTSGAILREVSFKVPYELPSGRTILLRGKWDGVNSHRAGSLELKENKTKGDPNPEKHKEELPNNLQSMTYQIALRTATEKGLYDLPSATKFTTLYNVIRRPLSGMQYNIRQRKGRQTKQGIKGAESKQEFYARLEELIEENVSDFFFRIECSLETSDMERFRRECFDPILDNLCDWYEWQKACCEDRSLDPFDSEQRRELFPEHLDRHFRLPFGVYNPVLEGRADLDGYHQYVTTGDTSYLRRKTELFPELDPEERTT